jgi:hypothetical protein
VDRPKANKGRRRRKTRRHFRDGANSHQGTLGPDARSTEGSKKRGGSVEITRQLIECAEECLGWAETAKSEQERGTFVGMAKAWLEAATSRFSAASQPSSGAAAPLGLTSREQPAKASTRDRSIVE